MRNTRILQILWRGLEYVQTVHWLAGGVIGGGLAVAGVLGSILGVSAEVALAWLVPISVGTGLVVVAVLVYFIGRRRPSFRVELLKPPLDDLQQPIRLQIHNDGPTSEFEAQVVAVEGDDGHHQPPWHLRWQAWDGPRKEILFGDTYMVELARWEPDTAQGTGPWRPGFRLATTTEDPHIAPDQTGLRSFDDLYKQPILLTVKVSSVRPVSHRVVPVSLRLSPSGHETYIRARGSRVPSKEAGVAAPATPPNPHEEERR